MEALQERQAPQPGPPEQRQQVAIHPSGRARGPHPTCKTWDRGIGRGFSPASATNISTYVQLVTTCSRPGCAALVQVASLRRKPRKASAASSSTAAAPSTCCGSRKCAKKYAAARFLTQQTEAAAAWLRGERRLLVRAADLTSALTAEEYTSAEAAAIIEVAVRTALREAKRMRAWEWRGDDKARYAG